MGHEDEHLSDVAAGQFYGTSIGSFGYWLLQLLDKVSPSQWAAIGVLGSLLLGLLTYLSNLYFKSKMTAEKRPVIMATSKTKLSAAVWGWCLPERLRPSSSISS